MNSSVCFYTCVTRYTLYGHGATKVLPLVTMQQMLIIIALDD